MNITFDATVLQSDPTGIGKSILGLYEACGRIDDTLRVTAIHRKALKCSLPAGIESYRCLRHLPKQTWRSAGLPIGLLMRPGDVVHFPWNGGVPRLVSHPTVVTTIFDVLPLIIPGQMSDAQESQYRARIQGDIDRSDLLITCSEYSRNEITRNFTVARDPVVIYLAPNISASDQTFEQSLCEPFFLYVGGYDRRKGIESLLRVYLALRREGKLTHKLLLTGTPRRVSVEFSELCDDGVRGGFVAEMGYVSDARLHSLYKGATALVYPSLYEGFGLPPLEAMSAGCPVITTRGTSIPEICGDAVCYVNPEDSRDFAQGLTALETNHEFRAGLVSRGADRAAKFSWDSSATTFLNEIRRTHDERSRK